MSSQTAHIRIVGKEANIAEVIRCQQFTESYPRGNFLAVDQPDFELQSYE